MIDSLMGKNLRCTASRGIDFPMLLIVIGGAVHEILGKEGKNMVSKCYSACLFGNFIAQGATPKNSLARVRLVGAIFWVVWISP